MEGWNKVTEITPKISSMIEDEYHPILAITAHNKILVMVYEQWDEDEKPDWYSDCSEHWKYEEDEVLYWMELPKHPDKLNYK